MNYELLDPTKYADDVLPMLSYARPGLSKDELIPPGSVIFVARDDSGRVQLAMSFTPFLVVSMTAAPERVAADGPEPAAEPPDPAKLLRAMEQRMPPGTGYYMLVQDADRALPDYLGLTPVGGVNVYWGVVPTRQ